MKIKSALVCGVALAPLASFAQQKPNIIYIMTDQQSAIAMSCAGNNDLHTPNMDRLAEKGMRFENAYCAGPLSGPSRAAMFTGFMPSEIGLSENHTPMPEELHATSLGELMSKGGYTCAYAGKWHVNTASLPDDYSFGFEKLHDHDDNGLAESVVHFLRQKQKAPFFVVASFDNPHNICEYARHQKMPFAEVQEVPLDECPGLPANFSVNPYDADVLAWEKTLKFNLYPTGDYTPDDWRRYRHTYFRLVEHIDKEVGKIVDEIDRQNLWDNTLIIFTSDHGDGAGAHQWNQKTVLYEEVANIPFIVCMPQTKHAGKVMPQLVNNGVDLMPTLCDFAGVDLPAGRQGVSFRKVVEQGDVDSAHQEYIVTETDFAQTGGTLGWMVRTADFKYVLYGAGRHREQLFDMHTDRLEMRNLAIEKKHKEQVKAHRAMLQEWMENHPADGQVVRDRFIPNN